MRSLPVSADGVLQKQTGLKEVPAVLKEYSKREAMEISLIENVQRADLNPIEEALGYKQLINEFGLTGRR